MVHGKCNVGPNWLAAILTTALITGSCGEEVKDYPIQTHGHLSFILTRGETNTLACSVSPRADSDDTKIKTNNPSSSTRRHIHWVFPKDDQAHTQQQPKADTKRSWVERTTSGKLIFHNADESLQGAYICYDYDGFHKFTAWVKVIAKPDFSPSERLQKALIAIGAISLIIIIVRVITRLKKNKDSVTKARDEYYCEITIPSIEITDERGEKVNQTVYDFM